MERDVERQLAFYLRRLEREQSGQNHPLIIADNASVIARCYEILGQQEEAGQYFRISADACVQALPEQLLRMKRPHERGRETLNCGRTLWWARDDRASQYFLQTLRVLEECSGEPTLEWRLHCVTLASIASLFMEDYAQARDAIDQAMDLREMSTVPKAGPDLVLLIESVLEACELGTVEGLRGALSKIEDYRRAGQESLISARPGYGVDLREFVRRKLASAQV